MFSQDFSSYHYADYCSTKKDGFLVKIQRKNHHDFRIAKYFFLFVSAKLASFQVRVYSKESLYFCTRRSFTLALLKKGV
jgi:hypothetical protein